MGKLKTFMLKLVSAVPEYKEPHPDTWSTLHNIAQTMPTSPPNPHFLLDCMYIHGFRFCAQKKNV